MNTHKTVTKDFKPVSTGCEKTSKQKRTAQAAKAKQKSGAGRRGKRQKRCSDFSLDVRILQCFKELYTCGVIFQNMNVCCKSISLLADLCFIKVCFDNILFLAV